jgi:peroxiredoxin Q/BCP
MKHLKIGDKAPNFEGIDQHGNNISSKEYTGKKTVIYFYPKDNTPGCTAQACSIRDNYDSLLKSGIQVIGISADSVTSHQKFVTKYDLPFPLIADENKSIIEAFGVWGPKKFMGKEYDGIHRTTFLLDEEAIVKAIIEKPNTKAHAEEILSFFQTH